MATHFYFTGGIFMKKLLSLIASLLLIILSAFCWVSCKDNESDYILSNQKKSSSLLSSCSHIWKDANCTTPKTCTKCGTTNGSSLGHTTNTGVCSRCNENFGVWSKKFYVDEFNLYTENAYIVNTNVFVGTFSNSATNNSLLYAKILVDLENAGIVLYEYGSRQVKTYNSTDYKIVILDTFNTKHTIYATMYSDRISISGQYRTTFINALKQKGSIHFYIIENEYYLSEYNFTVETSNFSEMYKTL